MTDEEKIPETEETTPVEEETAPADEQAAEEAAPAEKKENAFSRFWKKTKQSVNDSIFESKLRSAYEKAHRAYTIYTKGELIPFSCSGEITDGRLTVFGKATPKAGAVVIADDKEKTAYYVTAYEPTTVTATLEGEDYEREGTIISLDPNVEEVNVVKAGGRYFLYKGEET